MLVTATKITQQAGSVPSSFTLFDGDELEAAGIQDLDTLSYRIPGFSFQPFGQSGINPPVVRGLSSNFASYSSSALLVVDGVPVFMPQGFDSDLLGLDRLEVLRGPQSSLYGRNAEAGVISLHSRAPDQRRARVSLDLATQHKHNLRADLATPLVDDILYLGVTGSWLVQDGFIDNQASGAREDDRRRYSGRLALRWMAGPGSEATLRYQATRFDDGASLWGNSGGERARVRSGTDSWNRSSGRLLSLNVVHAISDQLRLHSVTAHHRFHDRVQQDTDFRQQDLFHIRRDNRFDTRSQELRLEGHASRFDWVAGLYLDREDHELGGEQKNPLASLPLNARQQGRTQALFGQLSLPLADDWTLTLGARGERNRVAFTPASGQERRQQWHRWSPSLALQYQWRPGDLLYATIADGFRNGGFNTLAVASGYPAYDPEKVRSFELGIRGSALAERLNYSLALYQMTIDDMQVQQMPLPGVVYVANAAEADANGAELELDYRFNDDWSLLVALAYNRTRFSHFMDGGNDYRGNHNPFAPDLSGSLGLRYQDADGWHGQAGLTGSSRLYVDAANRHARAGFGLLNLAFGKAWGRWDVTGYVDNLFERQYDTYGFQNGFVDVYSPPRQFGIRIGYDF
ncbi:TonB-dependent receptor [Zobellella sp. DQSA1]|uniref:TonB-dependent receptor n=1 Tax=Zobellella sp. DQSA1 TaxID=3342386 RepID=UPI0035C1E9B2